MAKKTVGDVEVRVRLLGGDVLAREAVVGGRLLGPAPLPLLRGI